MQPTATVHIVQNIQELQKLNETLFELFPHEIFASKKYYWCVHREPKLSSNMLQNFGGVDVFSASTSLRLANDEKLNGNLIGNVLTLALRSHEIFS